MRREQTYKNEEISMGDTVAIWRDESSWLAPARVTNVLPYYYEVAHNGQLKTSRLNRTIERAGDRSSDRQNYVEGLSFQLDDTRNDQTSDDEKPAHVNYVDDSALNTID